METNEYFGLVTGKATYMVMQASENGVSADDRNLVRQRCVRQCDGDTIVVRPDVKRVLMSKGNVDRRPRGRPLCKRRYPRPAASRGRADDIAKDRRQQSYTVFLLSGEINDRGFSVTFYRVRPHGSQRDRRDLLAKRGPALDEPGQIVLV